jgi:3-hydroxyacyl-[acyl-carrier-protein] dehydratase
VRFVLLDAVDELDVGLRARGVKCVSLADDALALHFPWAPIMPGALVLESLAQLGGVLIEETAVAAGRPGELAVLVGVDRARFRRGAKPGDRLVLEVALTSNKELAATVSGRALIGEQVAAEAELVFVTNRDAPAELVAERARWRALWRTGSGYPPVGPGR